MRISSLISRTKKFFSKRRIAAKKELIDINSDGLSRKQVSVKAREFHAKAMRHEADGAFNVSREKRLRKYLHNARLGRSDLNHEELPPFSTTLRLGEEASFERVEASRELRIAKEAREKAVMRRLYSLRELRKQKKN